MTYFVAKFRFALLASRRSAILSKIKLIQIWFLISSFFELFSFYKKIFRVQGEMSRRMILLSPCLPWLYFVIKTLFTGDKHLFPVTGVMSSEKTSLSLLVPSDKLVLLSVSYLPLTSRNWRWIKYRSIRDGLRGRR